MTNPSQSQASKAKAESLTSYGSSRGMKRRADRFRFRLGLLSWVPLAGPILVFGAYSLESYLPKDSGALPLTAGMVIAVMTLQALVGAWSLIFRWRDELVHSEYSMKKNHRLYKKWERIASDLSQDKKVDKRLKALEEEAAELDEEDESRVSMDDRRFGMRTMLYKFQRECATCKEVPKDLKPSRCSTCGSFWRYNF